jgi:DNA-directed RNA polymerase specialized sigma24 family protein
MKCHSCSHSAAIRRGDYNSKPWNELPCATCKLGEDTFFSIPFDEENPPAFASRPSSGSPLIPADVLAQFVQGILSLPSELRDIVAWRYQGVPYKEIACRQGISTQLAEMRHKRALREWPVLQSLFPYKTAKRLRRLSRK